MKSKHIRPHDTRNTPAMGNTFPSRILLSLSGLSLLLLTTHSSHAAVLTASDGAAGDLFGQSVSVSGNMALVGAFRANVIGAAYVYRGLDTATGSITEKVKLSSGDANGVFGISVSLSGNNGYVGNSSFALYGASNTGAGYVYRGLDTATGSITQPGVGGAVGYQGGDYLGLSVSLSGGISLSGAPQLGTQPAQAGYATVLRGQDGTPTTGSLTLKQSLANSGDQFGSSVSASGNIGLVGAPGQFIGRGAAYVFRNLDTGILTRFENVMLTASDGRLGDQFGNSVSVSGSIGLVGAYRKNIATTAAQGSAYVFRGLDTATGTNTQNVKLIASDGGANHRFGFSVSLSGSIGLVGADLGGSAYLFRNLDTATGTNTQNVKLTASDGAYGGFGTSVSLDGDQFLIGAPNKNSNRGLAYSGSVSSFTTLDTGNTSKTISGLSFTSQDDWIIGQTSDANQVTLSAGDSANVTAAGKAVYIGRNAGSDNNRLVVAGSVTATQVVVAPPTGSTGNQLEVTPTGSLTAAVVINNGGVLSAAGPIVGNVTNNGTVRVTGGAALQVTGTFINNGVLDLITGSNTLPNSFVNNGIVLDSRVTRVASAAKSGSDYVLTITGYTGHSYQLQRSDTLGGQWINTGNVQNGNGSLLTFTHTGGAVGFTGFYRVLVAP